MAREFANWSGTGGESAEPGIRVTLPQIARFLRRYATTIAGVFVFTAVAAYAGLSLVTEKYEIRSALLVKLGRENVDAPVTARSGVLSTGVRREELGSEVQILESRQLAEEVVDALGIEAFRVVRTPPPDLLGKVKFYVKGGLRWVKGQYTEVLYALDLKKRLSEREQAVATIVDEIVAEPQKESDVIGLRMQLPDPQLGTRIQETLIQKYFQQRVGIRQTRGVREFFEREASELKQALTEAEAAVTAWRQEHDLTLPSQQKTLLLQQIREVSAHREQTAARTRALAAQVSAATNLIGGSPERVKAAQVETPSASSMQYRERLSRLEADHARLLTTYLPDAAPVKTVEEEIGTIKRLLAAQAGTEVGSVTTALNPIRQQLEQSVNQDTVSLNGLQAEMAIHDRQLATLRAELERVEAGDSTLAALEREKVLAEQKYLTAVKRLTDADVEAQLDLSRISNVSVAVAPSASLAPVYPRKLLIMAVALALGVVLGLALALLLEWTRETVTDEDDVEAATNLVCLASFTAERNASHRIGAA